MNNAILFDAAVTAIGSIISSRWLTSTTPSDYAQYQATMAAFAAAVDAQIPAGSPTQQEAELLRSICEGMLCGRAISSDSSFIDTAVVISAIYDQVKASLIVVPGGSAAADETDVRTYGATYASEQTTCTALAGATTLTLANGAGQANGNWLCVIGAGRAHGMATPADPIAVVQGTTGSTTWEFLIQALNGQWGLSGPSAVVTVTTANAALSTSNFVELWPAAEIPGAHAYLVYARKNGTGSYTYRGSIAANLILYQGGQRVAHSFRLVSEAAVGVTPELTSVAPGVGRPNALWTQIVTGGGTTTPVVSVAVQSAVTAAFCTPCNARPFEDAIREGISNNAGRVVWIAPSPTASSYRFSASLRIANPVDLRGVEASALSSSVLRFSDGCGIGVDGYNISGTRVGGGEYRLKDRIMAQDTPSFGVFEVTGIAGGAASGFAASTSGDPAWSLVNGATYVDGELTLTFRSAGTSAQYCSLRGFLAVWGSRTIPALRVSMPRDLKTTWQEVLKPNSDGIWSNGITFTSGWYIWPTNPNATGKRYRCSVGGLAATEPVWPRRVGDSAVSGACTFVCEDDWRLPGAGVLITAPQCKFYAIALNGAPGWAFFAIGDPYALSSNTNATDAGMCWSTNSAAGSLAIYGADSQTSRYQIQTTVIGSAAKYDKIDASFYGNKLQGANHTGFPMQNRSLSSVQNFFVAEDYYVEGAETSLNDISLPGGTSRGNCTGRAVGATGYHIGGGVLIGVTLSDAPVSTLAERLTGGVAWRNWAGSTSARTWAWQLTDSVTSTTGRIRERWNADDTETVGEQIVYGARGRVRAFWRGILTGSGGDGSEGLLSSVISLPTTGVFAGGDYLQWVTVDPVCRLGVFAARRGALGATARANSTVYARELLYTASSRVFVVVKTGTSASSPPAALAAAVIGQFVTDGTAIVQCWGTDQNPLLRADPVRMTPSTLADASATVQPLTANNLVCAAATANRTVTLGVTSLIAGDLCWIRNPNNVAFTWQFDNGGPGAGTLATFAALTPNSRALFGFDGTNWVREE